MYDNTIEYIEDYGQLNEICKNIKKTNIIGIDTEFIRKYTYYPILCLIQVIYFDKNINTYKIAVIDTIKIQNIDIFLNILSSRRIKKIFFSCGQDIDAFLFLMQNNKVNNIDDLQIMMEFCGFNSNIGYANCVKKILGISFDKDKNIQISNWEKRPLTKEQINYAISDVVYLISMYNYLYNLLIENGNYNYYTNEIKHIIKTKNKTHLINNAWKRLKFNLHKQSVSYVLLIKELCKWREEKAIELNKTRGLILSDQSLELITEYKPRTNSELKLLYIDNFDLINLKKTYKIEILEIVNNFTQQYNNMYENDIFYTSERGFPQKKLLNNIYKNMNCICNKLNISITKAINKMDLILLIMNYEKKNNILYGWKYEVFKYIFLQKC